MIKHIVLFRFRDDVDTATATAAAQKFSDGIMALPAIIPQIRKVEVGTNINPEESWDICLYSEFASLEDVRLYSAHPSHVKVASELKKLLAGRSCVDYEI